MSDCLCKRRCGIASWFPDFKIAGSPRLRLSKFLSNHFHDLLASYAIEHPGRRTGSLQAGVHSAHSRQQRGSVRRPRHRIAIAWAPYADCL